MSNDALDNFLGRHIVICGRKSTIIYVIRLSRVKHVIILTRLDDLEYALFLWQRIRITSVHIGCNRCCAMADNADVKVLDQIVGDCIRCTDDNLIDVLLE